MGSAEPVEQSAAAAPVALVTGSTSGIGLDIAERLLDRGWRVVLNSLRSPERGAELAERWGPDCHYIRADVAAEDAPQRLITETVARFGRLDCLVNNAGETVVIPHHHLRSATPEVFARLFAVNVIAAWSLAVEALPWLRASGRGCVVNISSVAGIRPLGSSIPYAVSKAALNHLTRLLANVAGPAVRVNAVAPGLIATAWTKDATDAMEQVELVAPLHRAGSPPDVAEAVLFVIEASYLTGQTLVVDGGLTLRR